ncbi:MAG: hypothetical protein WB952_13770 [Terriglobales bacterium]
MKRFPIACVILALVALSFDALPSVAQQASDVGTPVGMVVTVEARHGSAPPELSRDDVTVYEGHDRDKVTDWVPMRGDQATLELFILLDDSSNRSQGSQLEDIRQFIAAQPPTSKVGVAYMRDGSARIEQNLTADHAQAAKALRLPLGQPGINGSPYFALTDLIHRWPESTARREVLMITDGIDHYWESSGQDPYVDSAITDAQRAGIIVFAIYTPGEGHDAHSYWRTNWGQNYLSQVADETGGESYSVGFYGPPVSISPYLDDLTRRFNRQYRLTFLAKPEKKAGMQRVRLQTEVPNAELVGASQVYVPAVPQ